MNILRSLWPVLGTALLLAAAGCASDAPGLADPTAPQPGYQRKIMLVVEGADFRPAAGAEVKIEVEYPTRLVSPASGRAKTDRRGALALVFEPLPHYDRQAVRGGDVVVEFPTSAKLTITRRGRPPAVRHIQDRQTFARYADPLYQGLSRNPETGQTYYHVQIP